MPLCHVIGQSHCGAMTWCMPACILMDQADRSDLAEYREPRRTRLDVSAVKLLQLHRDCGTAVPALEAEHRLICYEHARIGLHTTFAISPRLRYISWTLPRAMAHLIAGISVSCKQGSACMS